MAKQQEAKASKGALGGKDKKPVGTDEQVEKPQAEEQDIEADLQTLLLLPTSDLSTSSIKSHLGPRLLRAHGELIVSFGKAIDRTKFYHAEKALTDEEVGFVGDELAGRKEDLKRIEQRLKEVGKEIKVEVRSLSFFVTDPTWLTPTCSFQKAVVIDRGTQPYAYNTMLIRSIPDSIEQISQSFHPYATSGALTSVCALAELRMAVIGNVDAGKSTMLGVLTRGGLDDGRGKARVNLFRHKHEIESGRTSSVGMEVRLFAFLLVCLSVHRLSFRSLDLPRQERPSSLPPTHQPLSWRLRSLASPLQSALVPEGRNSPGMRFASGVRKWCRSLI